MRRWIGMIAAGGTVALALAGCGNPAGVDGTLTDDWAALPEPAMFVPTAGTCHPSFQEVGTRRGYSPVDCTQPHEVETLHLGTVTDAAAGRDAPPAAGSAGRRAVRADCVKRVNKLLGGDRLTARIGLAVVFPSTAAWRGGARWYRCDVYERDSVDLKNAIQRSGSLRGVLDRPSELAHTCFRPTLVKDDLDRMVEITCTAKHRGEFAGIWSAPSGWSHTTVFKNSDQVHKACRGVIAAYAKIPNDGNIRYRVGSIYYPPSAADWKDGERGVQCFLWMNDRDLTRRMKGAGTGGFPINYA